MIPRTTQTSTVVMAQMEARIGEMLLAGIIAFLLVFFAGTAAHAVAGDDPGGETPRGNGTVYYVSASGNDSNSGKSPSSPWKTATQAFKFPLKSGDTVLFKRGDTFATKQKVVNSGSASNPKIFGAYGTGSRPRITGFSGVLIENVTGLVFDRLHFEKADCLRIKNSSYITISNSEISHMYRACINIWPGSHHIHLQNNSVHDCGLGSRGLTKSQSGVNGEGIYIGDDVVDRNPYVHDVTVIGNNVYKTTDEGISAKYTYNIRVEGNVVHDLTTSDPGGISFAQVTNGEQGTGHIIRNNQVYNIKGHPDSKNGNAVGTGIITGEGTLV